MHRGWWPAGSPGMKDSAAAAAPARSARLRRWREWLGSLEFTLARRFGLATREERIFFLLIGVVGVVGGLLGRETEGLIRGVQAVLGGSAGDLLVVARRVPRWVVVAAPSCGGLLVGLIVWLGRRPVGGEGMAVLIEAVALSGGKVAPRPALWNALGAIPTVGSGGPLGREGPMIRPGAPISSWLGQPPGPPARPIQSLGGLGARARP